MIYCHLCLENENLAGVEKAFSIIMLGSMFPMENTANNISQHYIRPGSRKYACGVDSSVCGH
jgi:hypothetical protein